MSQLSDAGFSATLKLDQANVQLNIARAIAKLAELPSTTPSVLQKKSPTPDDRIVELHQFYREYFRHQPPPRSRSVSLSPTPTPSPERSLGWHEDTARQAQRKSQQDKIRGNRTSVKDRGGVTKSNFTQFLSKQSRKAVRRRQDTSQRSVNRAIIKLDELHSPAPFPFQRRPPTSNDQIPETSRFSRKLFRNHALGDSDSSFPTTPSLTRSSTPEREQTRQVQAAAYHQGRNRGNRGNRVNTKNRGGVTKQRYSHATKIQNQKVISRHQAGLRQKKKDRMMAVLNARAKQQNVKLSRHPYTRTTRSKTSFRDEFWQLDSSGCRSERVRRKPWI